MQRMLIPISRPEIAVAGAGRFVCGTRGSQRGSDFDFYPHILLLPRIFSAGPRIAAHAICGRTL